MLEQIGTTALIGISAIVITLFIILIWLFAKRSPGPSTMDGSLVSLINDLRKEIQDSTHRDRNEMQTRLDIMSEQLLKNMGESSQTLQKHFSHTSTIIKDVTERLTKLDETNKQVLGFSGQLQNLENILRNPKQRGILGEYWLETLLGQVLQPTQYKMQYELGEDEDGSRLIPDAVIFVKEMLIPIDAKFSLENYNKIVQENDPALKEELEKVFKADVKKRIDETSKYIRTDKGTTNFAFMFVPAEGVFHNLITANVGAVAINSRNLIEYAFSKGVVMVSPTSFYAYLQTVIMGLKALQIEQSVKEVQIQADQLMRHIKAYEEYHNRLGKQIETTYRTYGSATKELKKIDKDIYKITDGKAGKQLELVEIEAPGSEEI